MKRPVSVFLIILSLWLRPASGQETLSLKDALNKAAQSNLALLATKKELGILEGRILQAGAVQNLELEAGMAEIPFNGSGGTTKELGAAQTFEIGGKRSLRRKVAQADLAAAQAQYGLQELDLRRRVKESYWSVSLAEDRVNFANDNLRFQQRFLARVQDRFQSGQANLADVARAKLEAARASNDLLVAEKNLKVSGANLNRLLGENIRKEQPHTEHLKEAILRLDEDKLLEQALSKRPERAAFASVMGGAEAELNLSRRLLSTPDLKTGLIYQAGEREDGRDSWGGRLGVTFPLWYHYQGERRSATARIESLKTRADDVSQGIALEIHEALLELNLSAEQIQLWKQAVDQATEAARLAEERYLEGEDLLVFLQARRELVGATSDYLEALRNYQANLAALEAAAGVDLSGGDGK